MKLNTKGGIFRLRLFIAVLVLTALAVFLFYPRPQHPAQVARWESDYAIHARSSYNKPRYYPLEQTVPSNLYLPTGNWVGRLILPTQQQIQTVRASAPQISDWVWLEVYHAPAEAQDLVGKIVRLEWNQKPSVQAYVRAVTRDVHFTSTTIASDRQGNVHPDRLNGRDRVGPLQSLAGARPNNDVIVTLEKASLAGVQSSSPVLQIESEPVLETGRFYGLVKILGPQAIAGKKSAPHLCPGKPPCPSEYYRVSHYNPASGKFDGPGETIRIPQQSIDRDRRFQSTPRQIETSPAGKAGWYIYGAKDANGVFVVQAIAPRSLFQLQPEQVVLGEDAGLSYIEDRNWHNTQAQKGIARTVLVDPAATQPKQALSSWREGDKALVLHNFGGIGGKKAEQQSTPATVTGHFAYGVAQVVRDPITKELRFAIQYQQVYANNPNGIISGKNTWANYMGNMQWGWLGNRPVSDVIIKLDAVTQDYDFDGIKLSPLREFLQQLQVMMARYRVGDGTGIAAVTPATSCIQDSSQALFAAIKRIKQQVSSTPEIQSWLNAHPDDFQTLRFVQLVSLGADLEKQLTPLGIVRADWENNANLLAGIGDPKDTSSDNSIWAGLTTWETMIPRQAHDELASLFLRHGAQLWFLRTNQVGGWDPSIAPLAPTLLLGEITIPFTDVPVLSILLYRLLASLRLPDTGDWLLVGQTLLIYGAIAFPLGFSSGFLQLAISSRNWIGQILLAGRVFFAPALCEELVFRVFLIPHPTDAIAWWQWAFWVVLSLFLFIAYRLRKAKTFVPTGSPTVFDRLFLIFTALLGLACVVVYALTGSLLAIVAIHWVAVVTWLLVLGGKQKLKPNTSQQQASA